MTLDICTNLRLSETQHYVNWPKNESIVKDKSNFYPSRSKIKELEILVS